MISYMLMVRPTIGAIITRLFLDCSMEVELVRAIVIIEVE